MRECCCLPVLVPLANKDDANAYRQQHGRRVVTFDKSLEDTRNR